VSSFTSLHKLFQSFAGVPIECGASREKTHTPAVNHQRAQQSLSCDATEPYNGGGCSNRSLCSIELHNPPSCPHCTKTSRVCHSTAAQYSSANLQVLELQACLWHKQKIVTDKPDVNRQRALPTPPLQCNGTARSEDGGRSDRMPLRHPSAHPRGRAHILLEHPECAAAPLRSAHRLCCGRCAAAAGTALWWLSYPGCSPLVGARQPLLAPAPEPLWVNNANGWCTSSASISAAGISAYELKNVGCRSGGFERVGNIKGVAMLT
jgi:glutaredoxin